MTHTPGPWKVYDHQVSDFPRRISIQTNERYPETLADLRLKSITDLPVEANARLIAAAPDMLAVLETTVAALEYWFPRWRDPAGPTSAMMNQARAAIARAKGEEVPA